MSKLKKAPDKSTKHANGRTFFSIGRPVSNSENKDSLVEEMKRLMAETMAIPKRSSANVERDKRHIHAGNRVKMKGGNGPEKVGKNVDNEIEEFEEFSKSILAKFKT